MKRNIKVLKNNLRLAMGDEPYYISDEDIKYLGMDPKWSLIDSRWWS